MFQIEQLPHIAEHWTES